VDSSLLAVNHPSISDFFFCFFFFFFVFMNNSVLYMVVFVILKYSSRSNLVGFSRGDFGRLGHGNSSDLLIPQPIVALQGLRIKQIACGDSHCLAVTMEGEVQRFVFLEQNFSVLSVLSVFLCIYIY